MSLYLAVLGASKIWIAAFDMVNFIVQFIAMRLVEKFDPAKALRIGLLLSFVVFIYYGAVQSFPLLMPIQILIGISWAGILIGSLSYLLRKHKERGTVSGQLYSAMYLSTSIGPFIGGALAQAWGFPITMFFGGGMSLVSLLSTRGLIPDKRAKAIRQLPVIE